MATDRFGILTYGQTFSGAPCVNKLHLKAKDYSLQRGHQNNGLNTSSPDCSLATFCEMTSLGFFQKLAARVQVANRLMKLLGWQLHGSPAQAREERFVRFILRLRPRLSALA